MEAHEEPENKSLKSKEEILFSHWKSKIFLKGFNKYTIVISIQESKKNPNQSGKKANKLNYRPQSKKFLLLS